MKQWYYLPSGDCNFTSSKTKIEYSDGYKIDNGVVYYCSVDLIGSFADGNKIQVFLVEKDDADEDIIINKQCIFSGTYRGFKTNNNICFKSLFANSNIEIEVKRGVGETETTWENADATVQLYECENMTDKKLSSIVIEGSGNFYFVINGAYMTFDQTNKLLFDNVDFLYVGFDGLQGLNNYLLIDYKEE